MTAGLLLFALVTIGALAMLVSVEVVGINGARPAVRRRVGVAAAILTVAFVVLTAMRFTGAI